ncbi:glutathione S-transferase family protein [Phenylobacterium sp.]|jgi:glutathione S-transferase|uniref:glutathione S-transferase family protein n=1 Tax=Phenylobacterium sp. TaxID=1871053 RepID=UPI002E30B01C|nr:glutathione S-transferase family protein [Phenylobacterium sp.]HEX2559196.1 glutathione S-transferase family protein [Phenylobacterium sp.]
MIPILFYGVPEGCSFGSIVALEWLGRPYRLCRIDMLQKPELFTRIAPVGESPVLITSEGRQLTQSIAILNHIAAHGLEMGLGHRQGSPAFDDLNRSLAFLSTSLFSAYSPLWFSLKYELDGPSQAALRHQAETLVRSAHQKLEKTLLQDRTWLSGERIGVADAYFAGVARWNDYHKVFDWSEFPKAQALLQRLQQDPAVRFAHDIEEGREPAGAGGFRGHVSVAEAAAELGLAEPA